MWSIESLLVVLGRRFDNPDAAVDADADGALEFLVDDRASWLLTNKSATGLLVCLVT